MINWLIFCTFVLSFSMTLLGIAVDLSYQVQMAPKVLGFQDQQINELTHYMEAKDHFSSHPVFTPPSEKGQNFAELYRNIIEEAPEHKLVSRQQKETVLAFSQSWLDKKHKINFTDQIDLLFKEIEKYSYWQPTETVDNSVASDLIVAGQIFLAHTFHYQPQALREALGKVRYFARVLLTTEDLSFKRAGLSLLEKENQFLDLLREQWYKAQLIWTPVPLDEINKYRKFLSATSMKLSYLTPPEVLKTVFQRGQEPPGFCAVLREKKTFLEWSRVFLSARFPFEPDFNSNISALDQIQSHGREVCHFEVSPKPKHNSVPLAAYIPYYRRLYGIRVLLNNQKVEEHL